MVLRDLRHGFASRQVKPGISDICDVRVAADDGAYHHCRSHASHRRIISGLGKNLAVCRLNRIPHDLHRIEILIPADTLDQHRHPIS